MLVSKKEKRKTKEKMKRNAEHSATTTNFVVEKVATNHFEKRRELEKKELRKKERKRKKRKERGPQDLKLEGLGLLNISSSAALSRLG